MMWHARGGDTRPICPPSVRTGRLRLARLRSQSPLARSMVLFELAVRTMPHLGCGRQLPVRSIWGRDGGDFSAVLDGVCDGRVILEPPSRPMTGAFLGSPCSNRPCVYIEVEIILDDNQSNPIRRRES